MARRRSFRSGFEQRFLRSLRAVGVQVGDGIVVGFSGGIDSLALATAFAAVSPHLHLRIHLVHVDHGIRLCSHDDALAAGALADQVGLAVTIVRLPEASMSSRGNGGIENVAREERYRALAAVAVDLGIETIALGHQANDQLESILLHLVRGAGTEGLGGMSASEERAIPWWTTPIGKFRIIRPLLTEPRTEIRRFVESVGLEPVWDESNDDPSFHRNWLRLQVVPSIERRWPAVAQTVARAAASVRDDADYLARQADELANRSAAEGDGLAIDPIRDAHPAIARRVVRQWLKGRGIQFVTIDAVERCLALVNVPDETIEVQVGSDISVVVVDNNLRAVRELVADAIERLPLVAQGASEAWEVQIVPCVDADAVVTVREGDAVLPRSFRDGDRWSGTNRPVREDLRRAGIPPIIRDRIIVVADTDGVVLVPAIYPVNRSVPAEGASLEVGVRWRKKS